MVDPGVRKPVWNVDAGYPVDKGIAIETRNRESPDHLYDSGIFFVSSVVKPNRIITVGLGACLRIGTLFEIEKFLKNKHSHIFDIASIVFLGIPKSLGW